MDIKSIVPFTNTTVKATITTPDGTVATLGPGSIAKVEIYESIYESTFHGIVTIYDHQLIRETLPILGQETIRIEWNKEDHDFECEGYITSVEGGIFEDSASYITLYFTSALEAVNSTYTFSRAYKGITSEIISKIIGEVDEDTIVQVDKKSTRSINYIVPYKRPLEACEDILANSYDADGSPLVMFQTFDGIVHINSITGLHQQDSFGEFNDNPVRFKDPKDTRSDVAKDENLNKYNTLAVTNAYDIQNKSGKGAFSSTTVSYDLSNKTYNRHNVYYSTSGEESKILNSTHRYGQKDYTSTNERSKQFIQKTNKLGFENLSNIKTFAPEILSKRVRLWEESDMIRANVILNPRPNLHAGMVIDMDVNASITLVENTGSVGKDEQLSGRYLISYVNHVITNNRYEMSAEIIKSGA